MRALEKLTDGENQTAAAEYGAVSRSAARLSETRPAAAFTEIARKMGIVGCGLNLTVTQELGDHRQAFAQRESP